jgi:hypothetical protein
MTGMDNTAIFIRQFVEEQMIQRLDEMKEWHRSMNKIRNQVQSMLEQYKDAEKFIKSFKRFKAELAEFKKTINDKFKVKARDKQAEYNRHKKDVKLGRPKKVLTTEIAQSEPSS